jgi:hypothetical protein
MSAATQAGDRENLRVPVRISRSNRDHPEAVILVFTEDCPYCGKRHQHGNPTAKLNAKGTYGPREPHCADHTHAVNAYGTRQRVTYANQCPNYHPNYVLVPVAEALKAAE